MKNTIIIIVLVMLSVTVVGLILYYRSMVEQANMIIIENLNAVVRNINTSLN